MHKVDRLARAKGSRRTGLQVPAWGAGAHAALKGLLGLRQLAPPGRPSAPLLHLVANAAPHAAAAIMGRAGCMALTIHSLDASSTPAGSCKQAVGNGPQ